MKKLLSYITLILCFVAVTGCTSTHVRVQQVLGTSAVLQDDSPAGRKALITLNILRQFKNQEGQLTNVTAKVIRQATRAEVLLQSTNLAKIWAGHTNIISSSDSKNPASFSENEKLSITNQINSLNKLLSNHTNFTAQLQVNIGRIQDEIHTFEDFFSCTNAFGLAPRIDWEVLRARELITEQRLWLKAHQELFSKTNGVEKLMTQASQMTNFVSLVDASKNPENPQLLSAVYENLGDTATNWINQIDATISATDQATTAISAQGFGGFVNIGVAEINPSDPQYRKILGAGHLQLSLDSFSEADADISGDANVIIVQESPGQFRQYQISNDPSMLMKNVSLLVSKATAAAAKYLSGGIAP